MYENNSHSHLYTWTQVAEAGAHRKWTGSATLVPVKLVFTKLTQQLHSVFTVRENSLQATC